MACGPDCWKGWTPSIIQPYTPPKGGWGLVGVPPGTPSETAALMTGEERWDGGTGQHGYNKPIQLIIQWLEREQGVDVDKALLNQIHDWADAQWCGRDPDRCKKKTLSSAHMLHPMWWAKHFWQTWNAALIDTLHPVAANQAMVLVGTAMVRGADGCEKCSRNWDRHMAEYPYQKATTLDTARVWLWKIHNLTRQDKAPTPYSTIAKRYGWKLYSDSELKAIVAQLKTDTE